MTQENTPERNTQSKEQNKPVQERVQGGAGVGQKKEQHPADKHHAGDQHGKTVKSSDMQGKPRGDCK